MKKAITIILFLIVSVTVLTGCTSEAKIEPTTVTWVTVGVYPRSYDVYVFTQDKFVHYDLTDYILGDDDGFDYFRDPLPPKDAYDLDERLLDDSEWDSIVDIVNANHFDNYPEDISFVGVEDVGNSYIEVQTENNRFFSGGWGAGFGTDKTQKGYAKICSALWDITIK